MQGRERLAFLDALADFRGQDDSDGGIDAVTLPLAPGPEGQRRPGDHTGIETAHQTGTRRPEVPSEGSDRQRFRVVDTSLVAALSAYHGCQRGEATPVGQGALRRALAGS